MKKLFAIFLVLLTMTSAACAETLRLYQVHLSDNFLTEHPDVTLATNYADDVRFFYYGVMELHNALLAGTFDWDVFEAFTHETDLRLLMEKGYLLDLSESEIIRDYVAQLYPDIAAQCVCDGKIYAVPTEIWEHSSPKLVWPDMWLEAGYTQKDIPQTYGEYLDFIDAWLDRRETDPNLTLNVFADFTPFQYDIHSYSGTLVDQLLDSHIAQLLYAGQPLSFSDPDLVPLLEKAKAVGERIFRFEPTKTDNNSNYGLFGHTNLALHERAPWQVNLRIHEDQPLLQSYFLPMTAVYAGTSNPELAIAAVENSLRFYFDEDSYQKQMAMLRVDGQPVRNSGFDSQQRLRQNYIDMCERRLAGDDTPYTEYVDMTDLDYYAGNIRYFAQELKTMSEADIRDRIIQEQEDMAWYKERYEYAFSPESLAAWQQQAQHLYFPGPNIFTAAEGYENFKSLKSQFVDGLIDARQLVSELDRIAWMMEMENQ